MLLLQVVFFVRLHCDGEGLNSRQDFNLAGCTNFELGHSKRSEKAKNNPINIIFLQESHYEAEAYV